MAKKFGFKNLLKPSLGDGADAEKTASLETDDTDPDGKPKAEKTRSSNNVDKDEESRKQLFGLRGKRKKEKKKDEEELNQLFGSSGKRKTELIQSELTKDSEGTIESKLVKNDREEDDNDNGDEDVHKMLEDMEIPDFDISMSFDEDDEGKVSATETSNEDTDVDYESRLLREEVFSKRYNPNKLEQKELQGVAKVLGVGFSSIRLTTCQTTLHELIFGNHSIILKKGPICFKNQDCDLILLTDGFIAAYQNFNIYNPLESRYDTCQFWSDIEFVELADLGTLKIQMQSGESFQIRRHSDGESLKCWLKIIEHIVILSTVHNSNAPSMVTDLLGWQYTLIRKPAYTAAVTGDIKLTGNAEHLNQLDNYNQSSPLHYAIQQELCSADMIDALLRAGADPNLADGEGRSAMYYAQRNQLSDIEVILKEHGGKKSELVEIELRGELFGGADQAAKNSEKRREMEQTVKDNKAAEAAAKAQSAQSQMSQNMAAMIQRGEKINAIDDKAQQLNDEAKQYGSLATQLKNQMKNKKWYQL